MGSVRALGRKSPMLVLISSVLFGTAISSNRSALATASAHSPLRSGSPCEVSSLHADLCREGARECERVKTLRDALCAEATEHSQFDEGGMRQHAHKRTLLSEDSCSVKQCIAMLGSAAEETEAEVASLERKKSTLMKDAVVGAMMPAATSRTSKSLPDDPQNARGPVDTGPVDMGPADMEAGDDAWGREELRTMGSKSMEVAAARTAVADAGNRYQNARSLVKSAETRRVAALQQMKKGVASGDQEIVEKAALEAKTSTMAVTAAKADMKLTMGSEKSAKKDMTISECGAWKATAKESKVKLDRLKAPSSTSNTSPPSLGEPAPRRQVECTPGKKFNAKTRSCVFPFNAAKRRAFQNSQGKQCAATERYCDKVSCLCPVCNTLAN